MAHFSHPRELEPPLVAEAVRRIRDTGAVIRTQAPLIRSINDDPRDLAAHVADAGPDGHGPVLHVRGA